MHKNRDFNKDATSEIVSETKTLQMLHISFSKSMKMQIAQN